MSKLILVVEDQEDNRQIIRDMLSATDYEITEAENGEQALAAIAEQRPDLILMDIQLPIIDGYEATRRIKADPTLKSIPIIAVTSYALSGERQEILIEAVPGLARMAALADANTIRSLQLDALTDAAHASGVELTIHRVSTSDEIGAAIEAAKKSGAGALNVLASPLLFANRQLIIERTAALRLPAI